MWRVFSLEDATPVIVDIIVVDFIIERSVGNAMLARVPVIMASIEQQF